MKHYNSFNFKIRFFQVNKYKTQKVFVKLKRYYHF